MEIRYHRNFEKNFEKLDKKLKDKVIAKIAVFIDDPFNKQLRNHPLVGNLKGKRALVVTGDCRIIFEEIDDYVLVIMLDVGTHNQVY